MMLQTEFEAMDMLGVMGNLFVTTGHETEFGSATWWIYASISFGMVVFSGIMSGLTLGLMSLSLVELEVLQRSGSPTEKRQAAVIFPVVQRQHQLLVTLLFCNAIAMEALPIFLDKLFSPILAIVLSVSFVLAFGEVIPQAVCSRYGLAVGSNLVWLVRVLMILCWPIAYPIAKVLDLVLGHNKSAIFRRAQLKALVSVHGLEAGKGGELTHDETTIINGALDLTLKTAEAAMTPIESTFTLDVNSKLDWEVMGRILARGHSRVPVFSGNPKNIIGLLLVKNLLTVRAENEISVSSVSIRRIPKVPADMPLYDILNEFQKGGSHMAAVIKTKQKLKSNLEAEAKSHANLEDKENETHKKSVSFVNKFDTYIDIEKGKFECRAQDDNEDEVIGIITLEDVFEEILQEEIVDETDEYIDVHRRIRVVAAAVSSVVARSPSFRRLASLQKSQGAQGSQTTSSNYAKRKQLEEDGQKKENRSHANTSDSLAKPLLGSNN